MEKIFTKSAGLDVHKKVVVCTVLSNLNGETKSVTKQFQTFKSELQKLAQWLREEKVETAVMESTSVYWYSVFEALEEQEVPAKVVNAYHVKNVPGRKTDNTTAYGWLNWLCVVFSEEVSFQQEICAS